MRIFVLLNMFINACLKIAGSFPYITSITACAFKSFLAEKKFLILNEVKTNLILEVLQNLFVIEISFACVGLEYLPM